MSCFGWEGGGGGGGGGCRNCIKKKVICPSEAKISYFKAKYVSEIHTWTYAPVKIRPDGVLLDLEGLTSNPQYTYQSLVCYFSAPNTRISL